MNGLLYSLMMVLFFPVKNGGSDISVRSGVAAGNDLTVSYTISIRTRRNNSGIGETYNGGVKTLFVSDKHVRLRLVSLMRMQSIYILPDNKPQQKIIVVKESGRDRYKYYLSPSDWKLFNQKYENSVCRFTNDTMRILGYNCKKAVILLTTKETVTVYYTTAVQQPGIKEAEPLFSSIPGLVLRYEYSYKRGTIVYTATTVNKNSIDDNVFAVPGDEFPVRKYRPATK